MGLSANPIRKVVTMLQDMQKTVEAEGKKEEDLFDKFMCYCSGGEGALQASITTGQAQMEQLSSSIEAQSAESSQLDQDIAQHKTDRTAAQAAVKESTALREKEAAEFAASSGEAKSNIQAMAGALDALKKGLSAALLQTGVGNTLRNVVANSPAVRPSQRAVLLSFLEAGTGTEGGSDQIIGIVEQMKETMATDLKESEATEAEAKAAFDTLMTSKTSEIEAAGKAIETKTARSGEVKVEVVQSKADLEGTQKSVAEDTEFKANLKKNCATKQKEWDERCKLRAQEVEAISETIELLNGDDALELFKKTLPSASAFIQTATATRSQLRSARALVAKAMLSDTAHSVSRHLILSALQRTGGFEKVTAMVDGMVGVLEGEQKKDDDQDKWCLAELEKAKEEAKATEVDIADLGSAVEQARDAIATIDSEMEALKAGLAELDKSVAEATEQRKKEHEDFTDESANNQAAIELLGLAKNRLNKFYNPTLYQAPVEEAPEFFAQVSIRAYQPGPPPETFGAYKKSESSSGVIAMIDDMVRDVENDMAEAKRNEEKAQKDYEETMNDAAQKDYEEEMN